jgi:hypothetical protein
MLARHVNADASRVPQIFVPYKEVLEIYQSGMKLPDDITVVWPDDNLGYIRQLPDARERERAGVWYEAHVALGATTTGTRWALAGAAIGGPLGDRYYALVANQAATTGQARVTAIFDDGTRDARLIDMPPTSRTTIDVASMFPQAQDRQVSLLIESIGAAPAPLVVEGAQYSSADGRLWSAGGAMLGARLP